MAAAFVVSSQPAAGQAAPAAPAAVPAAPAAGKRSESRVAPLPTRRLPTARDVVAPLVPAGPPPPIMAIDDVKAGMVGTAYTVFQGTKPEPFQVRVVSVMRNFLPKQDVILVRAEDERVSFSGIAAGMSGSPVYIDGKLVGAVAYAWAFSKEPIAGVTPIASMLTERERPRRTAADLVETGELLQAPAPIQADLADDNPARKAWEQPGRPLPPSPDTEKAEAAAARPATSSLFVEGPQLRSVSVPLAVSGLSENALGELTEAMRPFGLVPVRTGGGGSGALSRAQQGRIVPGSTIGAQLIRGDMNATAMGTVTWVDGNSLVAFGHPMMGVGEVNLPLVTGEVHTFIASQASSFKIATPLVEVGAMVQDRPACIVGDLRMRAAMMPIEVRVNAPGIKSRIFRAEVARNRHLTPMLAAAVLRSAIADTEPDQTDMVVSLKTRMGLRALEPVELEDHLFTSTGLNPGVLPRLRGVQALTQLLANPFAPVGVERLDFDVEIEFRRDHAEIIGVALPGDEVRAGDTVPLRVTLRPYAGSEYVETIPVVIPDQVGGKSIRIEVASGATVEPDMPAAENLGGYIENLRRYYSASTIVVSVQLPEDGAKLRGHLIPSLPQSALDTLRPGNQTRRAASYRVADRTMFPSQRLVTGKELLTVNVEEDALGRR